MWEEWGVCVCMHMGVQGSVWNHPPSHCISILFSLVEAGGLSVKPEHLNMANLASQLALGGCPASAFQGQNYRQPGVPTRQLSVFLNCRLHASKANIHAELSHSRLHPLTPHPSFYPLGLF